MNKLSNKWKPSALMSVSLLTTLLVVGIGAVRLIYYHHINSTGKDPISLHARSVSATTSILSTSSFALPELGVSFALPNGLTPGDLQYYAQIDRPGTTADPNLWSTIGFTTKSLLQLDSQCTAVEGAIGMIVRYSEDPMAIKAEVRESRPLGSYYYAFAAPQGNCTLNPDAQKLESAQIALLQQAFETISQAN